MVTEKNKALRLHNIQFSLLWKSQGASFNETPEELEKNFKVIDNFITEEKVNSHFFTKSYQRK